MRNLMCVKSIVTIILTGALVVAVFMFPDTYEETFKNAVTMVVTFYFAHQSDKWAALKSKEESEEKNNENVGD